MEIKVHLDKNIFEKIKKGKKKFEIRLGNKQINKGDVLTMIQRDENGNPTNNMLIKKAEEIVSTKDLSYWSNEDINKFGFKIIQLGDVDGN